MNSKNLLIYTGMLLAGILLGFLFFGGSSESQTLDEHIAETHTDDSGTVIYTCSMHPQVRQNEPGNCPICGMDLIRAEDSGSEYRDPDALVMTRTAMELAEIQTTPVRSGKPVAELYLPGKIEPDQARISGVTAHVPGRITALYVDYEGAFVNKGEKMASLYSPELITAQQELLETAIHKDQNPVLYQAARKKLELWELPISTIDQIVASGEVMESVDIVSPVSGYVNSVNVDRQQHVSEGTMMYSVIDLSTVWVMFDVYESQSALVKEGQEISFTTPSLPGRKFTGTVDFIDPLLNDQSRSLDLRVSADNPGNKLKPNMLAEGELQAEIYNGNDNEALLIPASAVMWTGKRSVVYVKAEDTEQHVFTAREVVLGQRTGDHFIVIDGLNEGEEVVTNGTFKLDSAAQLADKLSMMNRTPGTGSNRTGHEDHAAPGQTPVSSDNTAQAPSASENEQVNTVPQKFRDQLKDVVSQYLNLKNALVDTDRNLASESAKQTLNALDQVDMGLVKGDSHTEWMRFLSQLQSDLKQIASSTEIRDQRILFSTLSPKIIEIIKHFEVSGVYYQQFCPMSNNGKGAYWLSTDEEIANPYYGDEMHNCGETITRIEF